MQCKKGMTAYLIESNSKIREVTIGRVSGDMVVVKFNDSDGAIQVRKNRLFPSKEEAYLSLSSKEEFIKKRMTHYDYEQMA